jgi:glutaredoxin
VKEVIVQRVANVYVNSRSGLSPAVRALLESNGLAYAEIDVSEDASMLNRIREKARSLELPVVELDGKFAAGSSVLVLARTLDLKLPPREPTSPGACC